MHLDKQPAEDTHVNVMICKDSLTIYTSSNQVPAFIDIL